MKRSIGSVVLACVVLVARPSIAAPAPAAFEVVSVKPDLDPAAPIGIRPVVGNRFWAVITVNLLIAVAYGEGSALPDSQVVGAPSWATTDRYEIIATFDGKGLTLDSFAGALGLRTDVQRPCAISSGWRCAPQQVQSTSL